MAEGILVDVQFQDSLSAALRRAAASGADLSPATKEIATYLEGVTRLRFEEGKGPGGAKWRPSERVREHGGKTLILTGDLLSSIGSDYGPTFAEVGPERSFGSAVYAAIHQFGGTIAASGRRALSFGGRVVHSVTIPARPYVGFDEPDQERMTEILADFMKRVFGAGGAVA